MHLNAQSILVLVAFFLVLCAKVNPHIEFYRHYLHVSVTWADPASTAGAICSDGDIRLSDGPSVREGRVEVCFNKAWGTVCARQIDFSSVSANVVCRQYFPSSIITGERKIPSMEETLVFTYNPCQMQGLCQFLLGVVPYF